MRSLVAVVGILLCYLKKIQNFNLHVIAQTNVIVSYTFNLFLQQYKINL
jgi:hypothetical protein